MHDQEWFDDDFGLSESSKHQSETAVPIQHYQIYPYQDYYYIREIPNKPPPPYTPPGQASSSLSTFSVSNGIPISSSTDFKKLTSETFRAVTLDEAEISDMVRKATLFFSDRMQRSGYQADEEPKDFPSGFYSDKGEEDDTSGGRCHRVFAQFLFQLSEEILKDIYERGKQVKRPPWLKPEWPSRRLASTIPDSVDDLIVGVQKKVVDVLIVQKENSGSESPHYVKWGRKKRDFVDEILLRELRKEEAEWVTYDDDEVAVKMQLTESIFDELISETICVVTGVMKKYANR